MRNAKLLLACLAIAATAGTSSAAVQDSRESEANAAFTTYPPESLAKGEQGIVHYRVKIDRDGLAEECEVTKSSGHGRLDRETCRLLMDRGRFTPARSGTGRATRSLYDGRVHWRIG